MLRPEGGALRFLEFVQYMSENEASPRKGRRGKPRGGSGRKGNAFPAHRRKKGRGETFTLQPIDPKVSGAAPPEVKHQECGEFGAFKLSRELQRGIVAAGFDRPRPIQEQTIPAALEGRDILGLAQTGTGKTAAFALPILEHLRGGGRGDPRVLILAPTRELAHQISEEISMLGKFTRTQVAVLIGGVSMHRQKIALRKKPEILVACPGRLLDLVRQGEVRLGRVEVLVLDEADHMFDMGFLPDIRRILAELPEKRQNLMFSATMPKEIRGLANRVLVKPHLAEIDDSRPASTIEHAMYPVEEKQKMRLLERVLEQDDFVSAIVFTRTKRRAKQLAVRLEKIGCRAVALQGNMSQRARDLAMNGFRNKDFDVLVATDIAARGIDVKQVSHVVNFDMPNTPDAYTHRIGRTGRAEREGRALTFMTEADHSMVRAVERNIGAPIPRRKIDGFTSAPSRSEACGGAERFEGRSPSSRRRSSTKKPPRPASAKSRRYRSRRASSR